MAETSSDSHTVKRILVHGNAQFCLQFDRPRPSNLLEAQFSMQYGLAVTAVSGRATLDQFQPQRTGEPEVARLMAATSLLADRVISAGDYPPIEVELTDGRRLERHVQFAKGAPQNPLSDAELADKVASLIDPVLGAPRRHEIAATVATLHLSDVRALIRLLSRGSTGMGRYLLPRLTWAVPIVLAILVINFLIIHVVRGDPVQALVGDFPTPPG
jgi:2-methylcitrate dehydratase PrpD